MRACLEGETSNRLNGSRVRGRRDVVGLAAALALVVAGAGCTDERAKLELRLARNPYSVRTVNPGNVQVWAVYAEVEIRSSNCVDAELSFVDVELVSAEFGELNWARYDREILERLGATTLRGCAAVTVRALVGQIGGLETPPAGTVAATMRVLATDVNGNPLGRERSQTAPLEAG
jgi:hypothetical protein